MEVIYCPKSKELVDGEQCIAIKNLTKTMAEFFSIKVCKTVTGCPKEEYCAIFKCGWEAVGNLFQNP
jgi:hypothetical protein